MQAAQILSSLRHSRVTIGPEYPLHLPLRSRNQKYKKEIMQDGDDDPDDFSNFIVDDDNQPIRPRKKKSKEGLYVDSALQEAQDIFGLEFDLGDLDQYDDDDDEDDVLPEDEMDGEEEERRPRKKAKKKAGKKTIYDVYEPSELEKSHLTDRDNEIRIRDIPERFQIRSVPVKLATDPELDEEAEWIYKQAFLQPLISQQDIQESHDMDRRRTGFLPKPISTISKIRATLGFIKKELFEVPFIATYRKEYVEPELKIHDLWKVYEWDEKWTQMATRKQNMKRLFEQMQEFQFEKMRENPDKPLDDAFRALDQEDIERLENAQSMEELMDVYLHFQLYYGNDISLLQDWRKEKAKRRKKEARRKKQAKSKDAGGSSQNSAEGNSEGNTEGNNDGNSEGNSGDKKGEDGEAGEEGEEESNKTRQEETEREGSQEKTGGKEGSGEGGSESQEKEAEKEAEQEENDEEDEEDGDEADDEGEDTIQQRKLPKKRDLYTICKDNGLSTIAKRFGLTPEHFGENLRDNYQRHETEQYPQEPQDAAEEFVCSTFPTAESVLGGARHMVAMHIARDPMVRQCIRQIYYERAKLNITPTKKGKKEIDDFHQYASFKYIKWKPVRDLQGDQFLRMCQAEKEKLITMKIGMDMETNAGHVTLLEEIKQLFYRDEYSHLVQEWNKQRTKALERALHQILYPTFEKELKTRLLQEATDCIIRSCARKLRSWISVAPYQPDSRSRDEAEYGAESESEHGCRVLACGFLPEMNTAAFLVMLDGDGEVVDFLRMKNLLKRRTGARPEDREDKLKDLETLKKFILKHRPHVVAVTAQCRDAQGVAEDIKYAISELEQEQQMSTVYVELIDGEVAKIYQDSPRAVADFRDYPSLLRHAISIGRRIQDPLIEIAGLCETEDELLCLKFHPLQELVPKEQLLRALEIEFINRTNDVGVDMNRAIDHGHVTVLVQFICGLGPRKGGDLVKKLKTQTTSLENRSQLVLVYGMGAQVFLNCAGFIKIDTSSIGDNVEVLDGTRIHPETYEWARKMAVDALEYDEEMDETNQSAAIEDIFEHPDRLKDLDLDAFADELARQGYGNKQITLYDIRDELINRFKDHRDPFMPPQGEERFRLLTGETQETMYIGRMVTCVVTGFAYRKPTREALDQANPVRNEDTSMWQCPFCLQDNFSDLSEVWTHFDNGSCPGQAVGVKCRLDSGISGFIATKNISDKGVKRPEDRVRIGMTLHCRVLKLNMDRLQMDLTCRSSDLADKDGKFSPPKDLYFNQDEADKDKKAEEAVKNAQAKRTAYIKRVISHPSFKNITFKDAEKLLESMEQGECIVRPSSKGSDHLTVTWKVDSGIYQHIDIREEGKENVFSLGKSLWINNEEYEDLDEVLARHIQPMSAHARDILNHRYFKDTDGGNKQKMEEILQTEKRKNPSRIPYYFSSAKQYPGKFMLGYMPRNKPRIEFVTVTPDGYRYRGRVHGSLNGLTRWFKEHFRDPIPGLTPKLLRTPVSITDAGTPYTPGATPASILTDIDTSRLTPQSQQFTPQGTPTQLYNAAISSVQQQTIHQARGTPPHQQQSQSVQQQQQQQPQQQYSEQWNQYIQHYQQYGSYSNLQQSQQYAQFQQRQ